MKKFLLTFLILGVSIFAQVSYVDTIKNTNGTVPQDSIFVQDLDKQSPMLNITVKNLGAAACTLSVRGGTYLKDNDNYVLTTDYYIVPLRDSSWTVLSTGSLIIPVGSTRTFWVQKPELDAIKTWITNTTGGNVRIYYEGTKPD